MGRQKVVTGLSLSRPISVRDTLTLYTLAEARAFILNLPVSLRRRNHWRKALVLIGDASERGYVEAATDQIERALWVDERNEGRNAADAT